MEPGADLNVPQAPELTRSRFTLEHFGNGRLKLCAGALIHALGVDGVVDVRASSASAFMAS